MSAERSELTFGELLRRYRVVTGLTQEALAEQAHLSARGISYLEEGISRAHPNRQLWAQRWAGWIRAECEVLDGNAGAARARLVPLLDRPGMEEEDAQYLLPVLAQAYLELGELAEAAACADQATRRMRAYKWQPAAYGGVRFALVDALRVQALVMLRQEQVAAAQAGLDEALSLARGMPYPYGEARLLGVNGQLHAQQGAPGPARERLEAALAILRRLGARVELERTEQALGKLG